MNDGDNPYQAPEARPEQVSVPWKRPMIYTVAGSLCWFFAAAFVVGLGFIIPTLIRLSNAHGWKSVLFSGFGPITMAGLATIGILIVMLVFAGRSFLEGRGRRGLMIGSLAFLVWGLASFLIETR